ncbi:MAG: hypothetical protein HYV28_08365 [Ignavibacteriales bacterium]|nr:hypothetical protein [Ignavibacteriales bacterium]
MKSILLFLFTFLCVFTLISCSDDDIPANGKTIQGSLIGTWQCVEQQNDYIWFKRVSQIESGSWGWVIKDNGTLIAQPENTEYTWESIKNGLAVYYLPPNGAAAFDIEIKYITDEQMTVLKTKPNTSFYL